MSSIDINVDRLFFLSIVEHLLTSDLILSFFCHFEIRILTYVVIVDTVTEFSWEPRGERFAIVSSSDPNLNNPGPGATVKTDVSFYQLEKGKGDFKLLSMY